MNKATRELLILIDGSSFFYRAFHALPPLNNSKGQPTGAVYGVLNMIRKLLKDYDPQYIAVVFDTKAKTFRDDLYPAYKATRPPTPDELLVQYPPLVEIIEAMGLPLLAIDGVEADDVIGTLAKQAAAQDMQTIIASSDKDLAQLVCEQVTIVNTMNSSTLNPTAVQEKFGVSPAQIVDYLTLIGDKVDNVPGVPNVGPKTAVKWLNAYDSLDGVMQHAKDITGKVGENLRNHLEQLPLAKQLVTIKQDVALSVTPNSLQRGEGDKQKLIELYRELEFRTWLNELLPSQAENTDKQYDIIFTQQQFDQWLQRLKSSDHFAIDTETTHLDAMQAQLVGVSIACVANQAAYIPLAHDYGDAPQQLKIKDVLKQLQPLLADDKKIKIGQNLKYDMNVLAHYQVTLKAPLYDTMLESYVLNSGANRHDMDSLALKYLGKKTIHFEDIAGKGKKQLTFNQITIDKAGTYAAEDADITLQLHQMLWPKVNSTGKLQQIFTDIEMPLVPVLAAMERHGVLIDAKLLHEQSQQLAKRIEQLEQETYQLAGEQFNMASPKQLQHILFEKLQLPILHKTPKGQASTAETVLQELAFDYPLPKLILEYRHLTKLKSTYLDALPNTINPQTGRVHTSYNQAVTATGRLSSTDPNLQNIPIRTTEGRQIRQAFIAPPGYCIIAADYSQIELRIMAHLSQDDNLCHAFANGLDIHLATAAEIFNLSLEQVNSDHRRRAKAINFGLIYGMSAFGLAKQLETTREAAQQYMDCYFKRYPLVKKYMDDTRKHAHELEYVETLFGRRLYLPEINARNFQRQRAAERTAINAPMQGSAADIIKRAMIQIDQHLKNNDIDAYMIMQVHDELVFEVKQEFAKPFSETVKHMMEHVVTLNVPIEVDVGIGDNWEQAH